MITRKMLIQIGSPFIAIKNPIIQLKCLSNEMMKVLINGNILLLLLLLLLLHIQKLFQGSGWKRGSVWLRIK